MQYIAAEPDAFNFLTEAMRELVCCGGDESVKVYQMQAVERMLSARDALNLDNKPEIVQYCVDVASKNPGRSFPSETICSLFQQDGAAVSLELAVEHARTLHAEHKEIAIGHAIVGRAAAAAGDAAGGSAMLEHALTLDPGCLLALADLTKVIDCCTWHPCGRVIRFGPRR